MFTCEFCKKESSSNSALKVHQQKSKYCIKLQKEKEFDEKYTQVINENSMLRMQNEFYIERIKIIEQDRDKKQSLMTEEKQKLLDKLDICYDLIDDINIIINKIPTNHSNKDKRPIFIYGDKDITASFKEHSNYIEIEYEDSIKYIYINDLIKLSRFSNEFVTFLKRQQLLKN